MYIYRRKFRSRTSDLWTDAATVVRAVREEKRQKRERDRERERESQTRDSQQKEDQRARKRRKVAIHCVFSQCLVASEGFLKMGLAPAAGALRSHLAL